MLLFGYMLLAAIPLTTAICRTAGLTGNNETPFAQTVTLLLRILFNYVVARSALLFPYIALGGKIEWKAAWRDTHGNFFVIAFIYIIASRLPAYIVANSVIQYISGSKMNIFLVFALQAGTKLTLSLLAVSAFAWIYLSFSNDILRLPLRNSGRIYRKAG